MKICIIRNADAKSNASMIRVADALLYGGFEVCFLSRNRASKSGKNKIIKKKLNVNGNIIDNFVIHVPSKRGNGLGNIIALFNYIWNVFQWLKKNRNEYECIHSFDLDTGIPALLIAKKYKLNLVYHIADFYADSRSGIPASIKKIVRKIEYKIIDDANVVIVCTEERKKQVIKSNPKKLVVIHNTPVTNFNQKFSVKSSAPFSEDILNISYVGGLSETRFIKELLETVSLNERLFLDIAGYGTLENNVKEHAEKFHNIRYHGQVSYEESLKINYKSDIMVAVYDPSIPNHRYSAPNKVYEAMYFGKPIIVAKNTGIDSLVEKEKMGFSIDYNITEFNNVIQYLLDYPLIIKKYGNNSKKSYPKYSWKKMRSKLINIYNEFIH